VRLQKKCEQYYGEEKGNIVLHGQFSIETTDVEHYADFVIRTLQVTKAVRRRLYGSRLSKPLVCNGSELSRVSQQSNMIGCNLCIGSTGMPDSIPLSL
jgi:hypothetical protein